MEERGPYCHRGPERRLSLPRGKVPAKFSSEQHLDYLASEETAVATSGQLRCGPETHPETWGPGGSRGPDYISLSPPLQFEETGTSCSASLDRIWYCEAPAGVRLTQV